MKRKIIPGFLVLLAIISLVIAKGIYVPIGVFVACLFVEVAALIAFPHLVKDEPSSARHESTD